MFYLWVEVLVKFKCNVCLLLLKVTVRLQVMPNLDDDTIYLSQGVMDFTLAPPS